MSLDFVGDTMQKIINRVLLGVAAVFLGGCATAPSGGVRTAEIAPSATFGQLTAVMADQLLVNRSVSRKPPGSRIAIASFVDVDNLGRSSPLGIQLAENLMHEMHVRGFSVVDFKTRDALKVSGNGDFVFSRDLADLRREHNIQYFLSGTITLNADGAVINARLIEAESSLISSTAQGYLAKRDLRRLLNGERTAMDKEVALSAQAPRIMLK